MTKNANPKEKKSPRILRKVLPFLSLSVGVVALFIFAYFLSSPPTVIGADQAKVVREIASNGVFEIRFDGRMNKESVEKSILITPKIDGKFLWKQNDFVQFIPNFFLPFGENITLSVAQTAKDMLGKNLQKEVAFQYLVVSPPAVTMIAPISSEDWERVLRNRKGENQEKTLPQPALLMKGQPITVMFDRPVRALSLDNNDSGVNPLDYLSFEPAVEGDIRWLGTSAFEFHIHEDKWPESRETRVTLKEGFPSTDGGKTTDAISWTLQTEPPKLVSVTAGKNSLFVKNPPFANGQTAFFGENILPDSRILLEWSVPVELESFFQRMEITPERKVKNDLVVQQQDNKHLIYLDFDPPLARNEMIHISLETGIKPLNGDLITEKPYSITLTTLPDTCVRLINPDTGEQVDALTVYPDGSFSVDFCSYMNWRNEEKQINIDVSDKVKQHLILSSGLKGDDVDVSCAGTLCTFRLPTEHGTKFDVFFSEGLTDVFGQAVPVKDFSGRITVRDYAPTLFPMTRGGARGLYDSDEKTGVFFSARNVSAINVTTCEVPTETVRKIEGEGGYNWYSFSCQSAGKNIKMNSQKVPGEKNETTVFEIPLERGEDGNGIIFWEVNSPEVKNPWNTNEIRTFSGVAFSGNASLTAKSGDNSITVWATSFDTGKPIPDFPVVFYDQTGMAFAQGKTNEKGLITADKPSGVMGFFIEGDSSEYHAVVGSDWQNGIASWDFGISSDWQENPRIMGTVFTDRPIYRPGHSAFFKGVLREDRDASFSLPKEKEVRVQIENSRGELVYNKNLPLSEFGTFSGEFQISDASPTGLFFLNAGRVSDSKTEEFQISNESDTGLSPPPNQEMYEHFANSVFWVEEYKKPVFRLEFNFEKQEFVSRDDFSADIHTEYFFGAPVKNADVSWHIVESPLYFDRWSGQGWFSFGTGSESCWFACQENEEVKHQGEGKTDENGRLHISFPIETDSHKLFTLRATTTDSSGQSVSGSESFPVFSGDFVLGIRSLDFWLDENAGKASAEVLATDLGGTAIPSKKFLAKLERITWNSIKKKDVDGNYYWENNEEAELLDTISGVTNAGGKVDISFALKNEEKYFGQLRITVESEDARGNKISASDTVWRSSENYYSPWQQQNNDRMDIHLETSDVSPGETVLLFPASPFTEKVSAFITVERRNLLFQDVVTLAPNQPISLKVTEDMMPNAFISIILSKGKGVMGKLYSDVRRFEEVGEEMSTISDQIQTLNKKQDAILDVLSGADDSLSISLEKGLANIQGEIKSIMEKQKQLQTEADKLKAKVVLEYGDDKPFPKTGAEFPRPEIKMGLVPIRVSAEEKRLNVKIIPERQEYLPGEKVSLVLRVEDSLGQPVPNADLSLAVVDESLLALKSRENEDIFEIFFALRNLSVRTSISLTNFINRLNVAAQKGEKGGGGGGDLDLLRKKRGDFRDTAFWVANLFTDETGIAKVEFTLPDNTTTWQTWVTVNTADSRFGSAKKNFISKKPLLIAPLLPRFLIAGDKATVGMTVHNQSESELVIRADFSAENAEGIGEKSKSFRLQKGGQKDVYFVIQALGNGETSSARFDDALFTFSAKATDDIAVDILEMSIPILAPAVGETAAVSGFLQEKDVAKKEEVVLPAGVLQNMGNLFVSLTPGLTGNISDGLSALVNFPYGCAEQIMSAHLPNVVIVALEKEIGKKFVGLDEKEVEEKVQVGLQKLYQLQQFDGGFGFWSDSEKSYPYLTAYILFGLEQTRLAGYPLDEESISRAQLYLAQKLVEDSKLANPQDETQYAFADADARAFATYVLSLHHSFDQSVISNLFEKRFEMSAEGKAFLLLAAHKTFENDTIYVPKLIESLKSAAQQTDRTAFFTAGDNSWNFSSEIRSTAIVLYAFLKADPENPLIPKMMQFLRDQKKSSAQYLGGPWETTQNTAWVILAFTEFFRNNPAGESQVEVALNLENIIKDTLDPHGNSLEVSLPVSQMKTGAENEIDISKTGAGFSYDIVLNYFLPIQKVHEQNRGFGVVREYFSLEDKKMDVPLYEAKKGDLLKGKVIILVPQPRFYTGVTIPLPAGFEAINFNLETEDESLQKYVNRCDHWWCPENNLWYFGHREYRDDHIFLFADYLPAGRYEFEYLVRITTAGSFQHLPAKAEEIYHPETFGRSEGGMFEVKEEKYSFQE